MIATAAESAKKGKSAAPVGGNALTDDPLELYLRESSAFPVLPHAEQDTLLRRLIAARSAWQRAYLTSEPALQMIHDDLERCTSGQAAPSSLIPGPPKLAEGQIGPPHHAERLKGIFDRHVARHPERPFQPRKGNHVGRLVQAVLFLGFRPAPLARYREATLRHAPARVRRTIARYHDAFLEARRPLVEHNLRLVLKVARQFFPGPIALADLVQEGNIGLIRATESFSMRFGVRFSTYAHLWIRQAIIRALEDKSRTIRLPVSITQKLRRLRAASDAEGDRKDEDWRKLETLLANPTIGGPVLSLNGSADEDGDPLMDIVTEPEGQPVEYSLSGGDLRRVIQSSLRFLPERQRLVLRLRFGLDGVNAHTLSQIGTLLGLSAERVRQIQEQAFQNLRGGPDGDVLEELVFD